LARKSAAGFVRVQHGTLDQALRRVKPTLRFRLPNYVSAESSAASLDLTLTFLSLDDFEPRSIAAKLQNAENAIERSAELCEAAACAPDASNRGLGTAGNSTSASDNRVARQLDAILHEPAFQELHATWLGLDSLLKSCGAAGPSQIEILDITKQELTPDTGDAEVSATLREAVANAMSPDMWGGHPPAVLLADYQFGYADSPSLAALADVAKSLETVVVASAGPTFLPLDQFCDLNDIDKTKKNHKEMGLLKPWRIFRGKPSSRQVFLTIPPILLRLPYDAVPLSASEAVAEGPALYKEHIDGGNLSTYLWGNGVYVVGRLVVAAVAAHGWVPALSPLDASGMTLNYFVHRPDTGSPAISVGPTRVSVWHHSSTQLAALGFLSIVACKGTPTVALFADNSCSVSDDPSAYLLYQLNRFRLNHCFSLFLRHLDGLEGRELEEKITEWIAPFTTAKASSGELSRMPVREVLSVTVGCRAGKREVTVAVYLNYGAADQFAQAELTGSMPTLRHAAAVASSEGSFDAHI